MPDINDLKQRRAAALADAERALEPAMNEGRSPTDEERGAYNEAIDTIKEIDDLIRNREELESLRQSIETPSHLDSPGIGLTPSEARRFSLFRAITAAAAKDWRGAEFELEVSRAVAQRLGREPRGFFVPEEVVEQRASNVVVGTDSAGGYLVPTEQMTMIDMLRNRNLLRAAGARLLTGLRGDVAFPRLASGAAFEWVAEDGSPSSSGPTFEQVTMTPHTGAATTQVSRRTLLQSSEDVEAVIRDDLMKAVATGIDLAGLHGSGSSNQPTGIQNVSGVATVAIGTNGGALTWGHVVDLETEVSVDNADIGTLAYMTNAMVRGAMKKTEITSGYPLMIWDVRGGSTPVNGYPCHVTQQVASNLTKGTGTNLSAMFFGNWNDIIIGMWGGMDVLVDPYTAGASGALVVRVFQDIDIMIRHPESFAQILDIVTS